MSDHASTEYPQQCLLLALFGHGATSDLSPLFAPKRTSPIVLRGGNRLQRIGLRHRPFGRCA